MNDRRRGLLTLIIVALLVVVGLQLGVHSSVRLADALGTCTYNGYFTSLALDSHGQPHISSYEWQNGDLRYSVRDETGTWQTVTVASSGAPQTWPYPLGNGQTGAYSSLALDSADLAHISYYDSTQQGLMLATQFVGVAPGWPPLFYLTWNIQKLATVSGPTQTSLALDSHGYPHILYSNDGKKLTYTWQHWQTLRWINEVIPEQSADAGYSCCLKLDSKDIPHIAYFDKANGALKYGTSKGTSLGWKITTIDQVSGIGESYAFNYDAAPLVDNGQISLAIDPAGMPHISYYNTQLEPGAVGEELMHAKLVWGWVPISVPGSHWPRFVWQKYWWKEPVVQSHPGDYDRYVGKYNSMAIDSFGRIFIAFCDKTGDNQASSILKCAVWQKPIGWHHIATADAEPVNGYPAQVGQYCSIAVGRNYDYIGISYYDAVANGDCLKNLKYAEWTTAAGTWHSEVADPGYVNEAT